MDSTRQKILIVDDVELFIQLQISYLGRNRFDIHTARSGKEALEKVQAVRPDLILLDQHMPDMEGNEVCRILKADADTSAIPVVIVSSGGRESSRASSLSSGCNGLIFKPVRKDLLLSVVEELIGETFRKTRRVQVPIPATFVFEGTQSSSKLHSLSNCGAFLAMEQYVIRGDVVQVKFILPGEDRHIEVRSAAVMWSGTLGEGGPRGAGLKFLTIDLESQKRIMAFLNLMLGEDTDAEDRRPAEEHL